MVKFKDLTKKLLSISKEEPHGEIEKHKEKAFKLPNRTGDPPALPGRQ